LSGGGRLVYNSLGGVMPTKGDNPMAAFRPGHEVPGGEERKLWESAIRPQAAGKSKTNFTSKTGVKYLLAILLPPLAVLIYGKPTQLLLNIPLTICFWIPGMIHALVVVSSAGESGRFARLEKALRARDK